MGEVTLTASSHSESWLDPKCVIYLFNPSLSMALTLIPNVRALFMRASLRFHSFPHYPLDFTTIYQGISQMMGAGLGIVLRIVACQTFKVVEMMMAARPIVCPSLRIGIR